MNLNAAAVDVARVTRLLQERCGRPVVHENGFIQLTLAPDLRLHVWPDGLLVRQATNSPIHDHRFSFESVVLCGALTNVTYAFHRDPLFGRYRAWTAPFSGGQRPTNVTGNVEEVHRAVYLAGQVYGFPAYVFHETLHEGLTATVMRKIWVGERPPRILCPVEEPSAAFDREGANDPDVLWGYIDRVAERL